MALSKREKYISIGVGAAVALLVLDQLVLEPYTQKINLLSEQATDGKRKALEDGATIGRVPRLETDWKLIADGGLGNDPYQASLNARSQVEGWANAAGVNVNQLNSDRVTDAKPFQVISFSIEVAGSSPSMFKFLSSFESAKEPIRIVDLTVVPKTEGTDNLNIRLNISTLCLKPVDEKTGGAGVTSAAIGGTQSWN